MRDYDKSLGYQDFDLTSLGLPATYLLHSHYSGVRGVQELLSEDAAWTLIYLSAIVRCSHSVRKVYIQVNRYVADDLGRQ